MNLYLSPLSYPPEKTRRLEPWFVAHPQPNPNHTTPDPYDRIFRRGIMLRDAGIYSAADIDERDNSGMLR